MKVIVAKTAGFCWGVKRAMDAVLEASVRNDGRAVQTLGPLIHNPQALELIGRRGVAVAILLDRELELYPTIYPAAGTDATGVPLTFSLLAKITGGRIVDLSTDQD